MATPVLSRWDTSVGRTHVGSQWGIRQTLMIVPFDPEICFFRLPVYILNPESPEVKLVRNIAFIFFQNIETLWERLGKARLSGTNLEAEHSSIAVPIVQQHLLLNDTSKQRCVYCHITFHKACFHSCGTLWRYVVWWHLSPRFQSVVPLASLSLSLMSSRLRHKSAPFSSFISDWKCVSVSSHIHPNTKPWAMCCCYSHNLFSPSLDLEIEFTIKFPTYRDGRKHQTHNTKASPWITTQPYSRFPEEVIEHIHYLRETYRLFFLFTVICRLICFRVGSPMTEKWRSSSPEVLEL